MNDEYKDALIRCGTDMDAVLQRLSGDENVYELCLSMFLEDQSMEEFGRALQECAWDDAFTAVHALKGVAGNMGFIPLFHAAAEMVILIRSGRTKELNDSYGKLRQCYKDVSEVIRRNNKDTVERGGCLQ